MQQILLLIHILIGLAIIALVMMQQGKGSSMGAGFGSGASGTVFGSEGSLPFLFKLTVFCAAIFFATSLGISILASHSKPQQSSIMDLKAPQTSSLPLPAKK